MANREIIFVVLVLFSILAISRGYSHIKNKDTLTVCNVPESSFSEGSKKLFVFGDSYLDTGNIKPARYSDGCILTDFIASFLGIHSPVFIGETNSIVKEEELRYGMNFALAGSGVIWDYEISKNMSFQINNLKEQIDKKVYTKSDLESSVALLSNSGNDYIHYRKKRQDNSIEGMKKFTEEVVAKLTENLKEIHQLGVRRLAILGAPPLGCWPSLNAEPRQLCNESLNQVMRLHNQLLQHAVQNLNKETMEETFIYLELYNSTMSAINKSKGTPNYENPLEPCCVGLRKEDYCGAQDDKGKISYTECRNPELSVFWDDKHLSHTALLAVYHDLVPSLNKLR